MTSPSDFVGTWGLESFDATAPNGEALHLFGKCVVGRITYHADGRMSVQIMSKDRAPFSNEDPRRAPVEEIAHAFATYLGYYGTYTVDLDAGEVIHHIEAASIPNWVGTDQLRRFEFGEGTLRLSTPPILMDGVAAESVLLWHRDYPAS